jgi:hypothetical protein
MSSRGAVIGSAAMRTRLLALLLVAACDSGYPAPGDKPSAPAANDPAYRVHDIKSWYLIGNPATPGDDTLQLAVDVPDGTDYVDMWLGDQPGQRLDDAGGNTKGVRVPLADLPAGTYDLLLAANGSDTAFAKVTFHRSAPYYVMVSTDWDFSDPGKTAITDQDWMHTNHPGMRITHFVGPYTFTDPAVTADRQAELVTWLVKQRDTFHDEIGLHIHPYCNFVEDAGVTCVTDQSTVYTSDITGYTIKLGAYDRPTMGILLQHASDLFEQHGLNRPKTFRAGGWTATLDTLGALVDKGFTADASALNWARIEEWMGKELYTWTMAHWAPIGDTSQPWWPSQTDILSSADPAMGLLEVPDNGVMIDYVSLAEMTGIFDSNFPSGAPLAAPTTLMMGFHPAVQFSDDENQRVEMFLSYSDQHLATRDLGPVVYTTLSDVEAAFSKN